ncbi:ABC transporter ATP-binding protein [Cohnella faecalis]|nr:ABC transporter ATP-binding protein [Cohnella faecalis]
MDKSTIPQLKNLFVRILPMLWKIAPGLFTVSIFIHLLQAAIPSLQLYLTQQLIDGVVSMINNEPGSWNHAVYIVGLQGAALALDNGLRTCGTYVMAATKQKANYELNRIVIDKCSKLPLVYFDQPQYYDQLQRVSKGVEYRGISILEYLFQLLQSVFTIAGFLVILANLHYTLAVGMVLLVIPILLINIKIGKQKYRQMVEQTEKSRKVDYLSELLKEREAAKEMRVFELFPFMKMRWRKLYWDNAGEQIALERRSLLKQFGAELISGIVTLCITFYLLLLTYRGQLTLGSFAALNQALATTRHQLIIAVVNMSRIHEELLFMNEWFAFLSMPEKSDSALSETTGETREEGIQVRNLTFAYPGHSEPVLKNVSFDVKPKQKVAIVGSNGAGKSTLIKCIMALYEPQQGHVSIDGERADKDGARYNKFSVVFQDFVRFQFSVQHSIGFGNLDRLEDRAWAEVAAAKAGASEFIDRMPRKFDTLLGPMFDEGHELSYGQWQKVALGRAFFKDAEFIVLDEPTSALDPIAEAQLFEQFAKLTEGKTTFMVSHRLGSCRFADHILVLKDGRLIEQGTHNELLALNGEYAEMYTTQSQWYETPN